MALIFHSIRKTWQMAKEQENKDKAYAEERNTEPHPETGNIDHRNNNVAMSTPGAEGDTIEGASNSGIGDAAVNDQKLTTYTSNRSADA
jgi:hypothetical protein